MWTPGQKRSKAMVFAAPGRARPRRDETARLFFNQLSELWPNEAPERPLLEKMVLNRKADPELEALRAFLQARSISLMRETGPWRTISTRKAIAATGNAGAGPERGPRVHSPGGL